MSQITVRAAAFRLDEVYTLSHGIRTAARVLMVEFGQIVPQGAAKLIWRACAMIFANSQIALAVWNTKDFSEQSHRTCPCNRLQTVFFAPLPCPA